MIWIPTVFERQGQIGHHLNKGHRGLVFVQWPKTGPKLSQKPIYSYVPMVPGGDETVLHTLCINVSMERECYYVDLWVNIIVC